MGTPFTGIRFQALSALGPLPFAELETYAAGTLTPLVTYTSESLATPNAATVICDANGQADVWVGDSAYRFRLYTSTASGRTLVYDEDNYKSIGAVTAEYFAEYRLELEANSILSHIPEAEWPAIFDYTSTYDCTTAINAWLTANATSKVVSTAPEGLFNYTGGILTQSFVKIRGAGRPQLNATSNALEGGTIFVGTMRFSGASVDLQDIGVDHGLTRTASAGDGLVLSGLEVGRYARLQNVIGLGRTADDVFHAILVEGYNNVDIDNILGCRTWYGVALKLKKANVSRVKGYENAISGCILRSNTGDGICEDINIDDVITVGRGEAASGSGGTDYGFYIVVDNQAQRINVSNVISRSAKQPVAVRTNANLTELNMVNVIASTGETGFYFFTGAGEVYSTKMTNCTSVDTTAWAMRVEKALHLQVNGFFGTARSGSAYVDELIRVEAAVLGTQFDNINLSSNYGSTLGSIRLLSAPSANILGTNLRCKVWGNIPQPGYVLSTQTGLGITLTPEYTPTARHLVVSQRGGSVGTVTSIGREYSPGSTRFQTNSLLVVKNDDTQPLTISSAAANVVTKGGVDTVIPASGIAMFAFDGAFWVGV